MKKSIILFASALTIGLSVATITHSLNRELKPAHADANTIDVTVSAEDFLNGSPSYHSSSAANNNGVIELTVGASNPSDPYITFRNTNKMDLAINCESLSFEYTLSDLAEGHNSAQTSFRFTGVYGRTNVNISRTSTWTPITILPGQNSAKTEDETTCRWDFLEGGNVIEGSKLSVRNIVLHGVPKTDLVAMDITSISERGNSGNPPSGQTGPSINIYATARGTIGKYNTGVYYDAPAKIYSFRDNAFVNAKMNICCYSSGQRFVVTFPNCEDYFTVGSLYLVTFPQGATLDGNVYFEEDFNFTFTFNQSNTTYSTTSLRLLTSIVDIGTITFYQINASSTGNGINMNATATNPMPYDNEKWSTKLRANAVNSVTSNGTDIHYGNSICMPLSKYSEKGYYISFADAGHGTRTDGEVIVVQGSDWTYITPSAPYTLYIGAITRTEFVWDASTETWSSPTLNDANTFANLFMSTITCNNGVTPPSTQGWSDMSDAFDALDSDVKLYYKDAVGDENSSSPIAKAMARYDYIVNKYSTAQYANFIGRSISPSGNARPLFLNSDSQSIIGVTAIAITLFSGTFLAAAFFYLKKKKYN